MDEYSPITLAYGDGVGPEVMAATMTLLRDAGAKTHAQTIQIGSKQYEHNEATGISGSSWEIIRRNPTILKAPTIIPDAKKHLNLNEVLKQRLGLSVSMCPLRTFAPFVHEYNLDTVIFQENLATVNYPSIHRLSDDVISYSAHFSLNNFRKTCYLAFEHARLFGKNKLTCFNPITSHFLTSEEFKNCFTEIAQKYDDIEGFYLEKNLLPEDILELEDPHQVIIVRGSEYNFLESLFKYFPKMKQITALAHFGRNFSLFETVHDTLADMAGGNEVNPSGMIKAAALMLANLKQFDVAKKIHDAWLCTIEDGIHTKDIYSDEYSSKMVGTEEFILAVSDRLDKIPEKLTSVKYNVTELDSEPVKKHSKKQLVGVDIFINWPEEEDLLTNIVLDISKETALKPQMITYKGILIWPSKQFIVREDDYFCIRFLPEGVHEKKATNKDVSELLSKLANKSLEFVKTENLYLYDGRLGFSLATM